MEEFVLESKKLEEYIMAYNSLKNQRDIVGNIDKDFFFDFTDCLLERLALNEKNSNIYGKFIL